ncbi:hypothetical protein EZV62_008085 [Acer yangbiense]|uniref:EF-hand domain-containing protein n=1 Tax=Acer yangbiense TaxID=1000413 RepID=A0A5C7IBR6_9ROSI|nr:hypothetical protein EZV62_008085 [Acer yangbiense]
MIVSSRLISSRFPRNPLFYLFISTSISNSLPPSPDLSFVGLRKLRRSRSHMSSRSPLITRTSRRNTSAAKHRVVCDFHSSAKLRSAPSAERLLLPSFAIANLDTESSDTTLVQQPDSIKQSQPKVFQKKIQKRRIAYAKHRHVISGILKHLRERALGRLLNDQGEPNIDVIKRLFDAIDVNKDSHLSRSELKALIIGIRFDEIDLDQDDAVEKLLTDFDMSNDSLIDINEFITVVSKWLNEASRGRPADAGPETIKVLHDYHEQTRQEHALLLGAEDQSDEIVEDVENPKWNSFKAKMMLLLGTIIAAAFADPLVDAVDNFSNATSIPSFFVSFIALPLATNSREAISAIIFASRKKIRTASLTFSELYGIITTNNVVSPSVFLALVYMRELTWEFSSEVLVILIVCLVMGGLASFRTRFPLWTCSVAYILYPFSLALVYVLHYVFGWS